MFEILCVLWYNTEHTEAENNNSLHYTVACLFCCLFCEELSECEINFFLYLC